MYTRMVTRCHTWTPPLCTPTGRGRKSESSLRTGRGGRRRRGRPTAGSMPNSDSVRTARHPRRHGTHRGQRGHLGLGRWLCPRAFEWRERKMNVCALTSRRRQSRGCGGSGGGMTTPEKRRRTLLESGQRGRMGRRGGRTSGHHERAQFTALINTRSLVSQPDIDSCRG